MDDLVTGGAGIGPRRGGQRVTSDLAHVKAIDVPFASAGTACCRTRPSGHAHSIVKSLAQNAAGSPSTRDVIVNSQDTGDCRRGPSPG